ncbi:MAG: hypothetical protein GKR95_04695 [Gammaproteobacteria bacterium]|nr:hypothetical protein [Gammaproteobacteria bacterium]
MSYCRIIFYRKDGCHLCEQMACELEQFLQARSDRHQITIEERDIEDDSSWYDSFREYIPVLVVGAEEVCHYFMDRTELNAAISKQIQT